MKVAISGEALGNKFRELNSIIDPAVREANIAAMPPEIKGLYDSYNSSMALNDLYTHTMPTADSAIKATINGFTKATIGNEFFDTPRKAAREAVLNVQPQLEGKPNATYQMLQGALPKITPDDVYETVGNLAGVVSSVMLGNVAGLSGRGLATAVAGVPIAGGAVGRAAGGESVSSNLEKTAVDVGGAVAGFGTFGLGKLLGEAGTKYALGKALDPAKGFVGRTFGKLLGAVDQQLAGETIAKGGAFGGAAAMLGLGYAADDTKGALKMLPMVLLSTPNPVSKSLLDSLILAKAKRLESDPGERAVSDKFFQLMDKWEGRFRETGKQIQDNPGFYNDFMQFYKDNKATQGITEMFANPKKMFPGISDVDAATLKSMQGELLDTAMINSMARPDKYIGSMNLTFPKSPQQVMDAAQNIKNDLVYSSEVVKAMRGPATKYAGEGYKTGTPKQPQFDVEGFMARRRQAQAEAEMEGLLPLYEGKPAGTDPRLAEIVRRTAGAYKGRIE